MSDQTGVTGDDFLVQIQKAEEKAEDLVSKGIEKKRKNLEKLRTTLEQDQQKNLEDLKMKKKEELEKATLSAKANYKDQIKKGESAAENLISTKKGLVAPLAKKAYEFFLDLI